MFVFGSVAVTKVYVRCECCMGACLNAPEKSEFEMDMGV